MPRKGDQIAGAISSGAGSVGLARGGRRSRGRRRGGDEVATLYTGEEVRVFAKRGAGVERGRGHRGGSARGKVQMGQASAGNGRRRGEGGAGRRTRLCASASGRWSSTGRASGVSIIRGTCNRRCGGGRGDFAVFGLWGAQE